MGAEAFEQWKKTMRHVINAENRDAIDQLIDQSRKAHSGGGKRER